MDKLLKID